MGLVGSVLLEVCGRCRLGGHVRAVPSRTDADVVEHRRAVSVSLRPLADKGRAVARHIVARARELRGPLVTDIVDFGGMCHLDEVSVENGVLVHVEHEVGELGLGKDAGPRIDAQESVAVDNRAVEACALHELVRLLGPVVDNRHVEPGHPWFIDKAVDGHDVSVPRLRKKGRELLVHLQRAVAVCLSVGAVEPRDNVLPSTVVPSVLTAGCAVEVEVHAQAVLARPLNAAQKVAPGDLWEELVAGPHADDPVPKGDAHMVEPGFGDLAEGGLVDE